jgi:hypothetical protein
MGFTPWLGSASYDIISYVHWTFQLPRYVKHDIHITQTTQDSKTWPWTTQKNAIVKGIGQLGKEKRGRVTEHNIERFRLKLVDVSMTNRLTCILYQLVFWWVNLLQNMFSFLSYKTLWCKMGDDRCKNEPRSPHPSRWKLWKLAQFLAFGPN